MSVEDETIAASGSTYSGPQAESQMSEPTARSTTPSASPFAASRAVLMNPWFVGVTLLIVPYVLFGPPGRYILLTCATLLGDFSVHYRDVPYQDAVEGFSIRADKLTYTLCTLGPLVVATSFVTFALLGGQIRQGISTALFYSPLQTGALRLFAGLYAIALSSIVISGLSILDRAGTILTVRDTDTEFLVATCSEAEVRHLNALWYGVKTKAQYTAWAKSTVATAASHKLVLPRDPIEGLAN